MGGYVTIYVTIRRLGARSWLITDGTTYLPTYLLSEYECRFDMISKPGKRHGTKETAQQYYRPTALNSIILAEEKR